MIDETSRKSPKPGGISNSTRKLSRAEAASAHPRSAMRLLPIALVVSLLGLLFIVSCILFTCYMRRKRSEWREGPEMIHDNHTRQLTVRSGKVIPKSEAFPTPSTREVRSLDLSTMRSVRSVNSTKSKFSQDRFLHSPRTRSFDRRRSSAAADPEAQNEAAEAWESNVKDLRHLDLRLRDPRFNFNGEGERKGSISSQKIAASLKKAYKGTPTLETETVEIPPTIGSEPTEIRTLVRKKKSDSNLKRSSLVKVFPDESDTGKLSPTLRKQQSAIQQYSRNASSSFQGSGHIASAKAIQPPPPALLPLVSRHSAAAHLTLPDNRNPSSFLSTSASSSASIHLPKIDALGKVPPPSPEETPTVEFVPQPVDHNRLSTPQPSTESQPNTQSRRIKLADIETDVSDLGETFFIDSATTTTQNANGFQRDSFMSNSSLATFASSDLSSTWTFGKAQPIAILPSVLSRAATASPNARRPKSKYGRFSKPRREKDLPILPRSPLSPVSPLSPLVPLSPISPLTPRANEFSLWKMTARDLLWQAKLRAYLRHPWDLPYRYLHQPILGMMCVQGRAPTVQWHVNSASTTTKFMNKDGRQRWISCIALIDLFIFVRWNERKYLGGTFLRTGGFLGGEIQSGSEVKVMPYDNKTRKDFWGRFILLETEGLFSLMNSWKNIYLKINILC